MLVDAEVRTPDVDRVLAALGLPVLDVGHGLTLGGPVVAVLARDHPPVPDCFAWYVGPGDCPSWMHDTAGDAGWVLRLLGTALVQERAGAAFRAAGAGRSAAAVVELDPAVLHGVSAAAGGPVVAPPQRARHDVDALLRQSFQALVACCADNGAIAAAPRAAPGAPDYWFFWQRDAAAAATALLALAAHGPHDLRAAAAERVQAYVAFVSELEDLSAGRCTMTGGAVPGYGDPQHDGAAATALVLLAAGAPAGRLLDHLLTLEGARGYDLWELREGHSFHAANLRRRALLHAGLPAAPVSASRMVTSARPPWFGVTSPLDAAVAGSALLAFDPEVDDLSEPALVRAVTAVERHYAERWPTGGIGRFPEDANDGLGSTGGGAWPVTTLWLAQWHLRRGDRNRGLAHLDWVLARVDPVAISEQVDPRTGVPRGARGLAWSHAELVTTLLLLRGAGRGSAGGDDLLRADGADDPRARRLGGGPGAVTGQGPQEPDEQPPVRR